MSGIARGPRVPGGHVSMTQTWKGLSPYHRYARARVTLIIGEPFPSLQVRASDVHRGRGLGCSDQTRPDRPGRTRGCPVAMVTEGLLMTGSKRHRQLAGPGVLGQEPDRLRRVGVAATTSDQTEDHGADDAAVDMEFSDVAPDCPGCGMAGSGPRFCGGCSTRGGGVAGTTGIAESEVVAEDANCAACDSAGPGRGTCARCSEPPRTQSRARTRSRRASTSPPTPSIGDDGLVSSTGAGR